MTGEMGKVLRPREGEKEEEVWEWMIGAKMRVECLIGMKLEWKFRDVSKVGMFDFG
jgi:hypothetical protein